MMIKDLEKSEDLTSAELSRVSGGMKWDHNYVSKEVIDARGGQDSFWGYTYTFDVNGNVSSVTKD
jgi:hypothetical protein